MRRNKNGRACCTVVGTGKRVGEVYLGAEASVHFKRATDHMLSRVPQCHRYQAQFPLRGHGSLRAFAKTCDLESTSLHPRWKEFAERSSGAPGLSKCMARSNDVFNNQHGTVLNSQYTISVSTLPPLNWSDISHRRVGGSDCYV